jgi:hypothetical protein
MTLRTFEIERDLELEASILAGVEHFWTEYFDPGIMPPFEPQRDQALIKALYPQDDGTSIDLGTHNRAGELTDTLIETRAAVSRLKKTEQTTAAELQGVMHGYLRSVCRWSRRRGNSSTARPTPSRSDYRALKVLKCRRSATTMRRSGNQMIADLTPWQSPRRLQARHAAGQVVDVVSDDRKMD